MSHVSATRMAVAAVGVLAVAVGLSGCSTRSAVPTITSTATGAGQHTLAGRATPAGRPPVSTGRADPHGWNASGIDGVIPAAGSCHLHQAANGEPLPDPACTPGAVDSAVTQTTLRLTVCRQGGYTSSVRPPESITRAAKKRIMAAYGIAYSEARNYELDHLVELNAGGSSAAANLWPEPNTFLDGTASSSAYIHNDKDQVESYTFHALCRGSIGLRQLQANIASDWTTAVARLGLPPIEAGYTG